MMKVIHVRESQLLKLIKDNKIYLPVAKKFEVGEVFLIDTECDTALCEIKGLMKNEAIIKIKEIQGKLYCPF